MLFLEMDLKWKSIGRKKLLGIWYDENIYIDGHLILLLTTIMCTSFGKNCIITSWGEKKDIMS